MRRLFAITALLALLAASVSPAAAQRRPERAGPLRHPSELPVRERLNAWTLGLAGGLLEGAPIRFAVEMARIADSGDDLLVLPIVTRGPTENVEALLYLRGVDVAIINTDALERFKPLVPNIERRITSVLNLFPSEVHVFVRPDIASLADLSGKKVNFNTPGTAAAYSGPLIFDRLGLSVDATFIPHQVALEQMRGGDMAAAVFVTSKPVDALARSRWPTGFKLLPVPYDRRLQDYYLPASLTGQDYPGLVESGDEVKTISVPTLLAAYNWPKSSPRYGRLERFVSTLFDRIDRLKAPGFHPKWKDVNLDASVPGLERSGPAQDWLDRADPPASAAGVASAPAAAALNEAAPGRSPRRPR